MIPDDVPPALKDLTFLEEMLICKVLPNMYIRRLSSGDQYGYEHHAIAFPQQLETFTLRRNMEPPTPFETAEFGRKKS